MRYSIYIDNDGDAKPDVVYQFSFESRLRNPNTFLYNTGPIGSLSDPNWNRRQFYSIKRKDRDGTRPSVGPDVAAVQHRAAVDAALPEPGTGAVHHLPSGETVFAGQRNDGFFVDLGSIFDLGDLRPFQNLHLIPTPAAPGVDPLKDLNVIDRDPGSDQTPDSRRSKPTNQASAKAVLGIWGGPAGAA